MRLLVLDHFFGPDIQSLRSAAGPEVELRIVPYDVLREEGLRIFPPEIARGLEPFADERNARARERYAEWLRRFLEDEFKAWPFDAFVAPSDLFFYVRAAPAACARLGVPFVVVQKETVISSHTMNVHSQRVRELAPPAADVMTVCSDRHREFWLRAGADPERVIVTGQPRFDFYSHRERWPARVGPGDPEAPTLIFFSYLIDAYHPAQDGRPAWQQLHQETEDGLMELARAGWRVFVKPHPQQDFSVERRRIAKRAGSLAGRQVFPLQPTLDARPFVVACDVLVGFQTTTLLEGLAAGTPVVYTGWDPEAGRLGDKLIPFQEWGEALEVVRAPGDLVAAVKAARERGRAEAPGEQASRLVAEHLGPLDGGASKRALDVIEREVRASERARPAEARALRERLAAQRPPLHLARRARRFAAGARRRAGAALGR